MKSVFTILAVISLVCAAIVGLYGIAKVQEPWTELEDVAHLFPLFASLISGALLSAFAASVIHGLEQQVAATKELHAAIVGKSKGEKPSLLDRLSQDKLKP